MRLMLDRNHIVESKPELRPEIDEALMQLAETLALVQQHIIDYRPPRNADEAEHRQAWIELDVPTKQMRCLGFGVVRALELIAERDPAAFKVLAENTIKILLNSLDVEVGVVEELSAEEAAMLAPCRGKPN